MMFARILFCPLRDFENPAAIRRVVALAGNDSSLTILGTSQAPTRHSRLLHGRQWIENVQRTEHKEVSKRLQTWAHRGGADKATRIVRSGNPTTAIVEEVMASGHDLVVVTTDDDHEDQVTIKRLLRECPCPVWVLRRSRAQTIRVMAAVSTEPGEEDLNRAVLDLAAELHRSTGGELHVAHAWELYGETTMRASSMIHTSDLEIDRLLHAEQAEAKKAVDALVRASEPGLPWTIHLRKGPVTEVVPELVSTKRINHLVVGTMARRGLTGLIIGNTAEHVVDSVICSVLVIQPPDQDSASGDR